MIEKMPKFIKMTKKYLTPINEVGDQLGHNISRFILIPLRAVFFLSLFKAL